MTLYLKHRPKNLDELDLTNVRESLTKIVKSDNIPHALLFSGPRGSGKTSAARILAKIINCEDRRKNSALPCDKCNQCKSISLGSNLDVIELDAASHRGIDDVRVLKDAVKLSPASAKKKIYIIDEAHMLTLEASNALLKTLEEPPSHVIFILATTNPEKLISTIRSRTTNIKFSKATGKEVVRCLERVSKREKVKSDLRGMERIATKVDGSFRDAIKILEQLVSEGFDATEAKVEDFFKNSSKGKKEFFEGLKQKDIKAVLENIQKLAGEGYLMDEFLKEVVDDLRQTLLAKYDLGEERIGGFKEDELYKLIKIFVSSKEEFRFSSIDSLALEMAVVKWCGDKPFEEKKSEREEVEKESQLKVNDKPSPEHLKKKPVEEKIDLKNLKEIGDDIWKKILSKVKPVNSTIEALLRSSKPLGIDGGNLRIGVYYKFHKERLEDTRHRSLLEKIVADVFGSPIRVSCVVTDQPKIIKPTQVVLEEKIEEDSVVKAAEEIFG